MNEPNELERAERIRAFREIAGEELDEETSEALLASNDWNVEATARNFFEGPTSPRNQPSAPPVGMMEPQAFQFDEEDDSDEAASFLHRMDEGGVRSRRRGVSPDRVDFPPTTARIRTGNVPSAPSRSIAQMAKEALMGQVHHESSGAAARKFVAEFDRLVGAEAAVPEFFESSFEDALLSASTERKLLVVYLHSPWHPFSESFCRDVLCSRPVLNALVDARVWGGSLEHPEGYLASSKVQAAGYPCIILITADRERNARVADKLYVDDIHEPGLAERFAARITSARTARPVPVATPTVDPRVAEERRRVLEEQDAALQAAIEQDRRREAEKKEREQAEEAERMRKQEEEERKAREFDAKRASIRPEPAVGSPDITTLRFQFPGGSKISRRFNGDDTVQYVRDVLDVHLADQLKTPNLRYALVLNYPKKTIEESNITLKEAGLVPQAVLFLQDLDA